MYFSFVTVTTVPTEITTAPTVTTVPPTTTVPTVTTAPTGMCELEFIHELIHFKKR